MDKRLSILGALGLGAGLMYYLDPDRGRRRRGMVRDKAIHYGKVVSHGSDVTARDLLNRARGVLFESKNLLIQEPVDDDVLVERVRAGIGRVTSHTGPIEVYAENGRVILSGHILADEVEDLFSAVRHIRGVKSVENLLQIHDEPGNLPDLQPVQGQKGGQYNRHVNYNPSARVLVGTLGGSLAFFGLRRTGILNRVLGAFGLGVLTRAMSNDNLSHLVRSGNRGAGDTYLQRLRQVSQRAVQRMRAT